MNKISLTNSSRLFTLPSITSLVPQSDPQTHNPYFPFFLSTTSKNILFKKHKGPKGHSRDPPPKAQTEQLDSESELDMDVEYELIPEVVTERMNKAVNHLKEELGGIFSGRMTPAAIDSLPVNTYGTQMPLKAVGNVSVQMTKNVFQINLFDPGTLEDVIDAVRKSPLELNPTKDSDNVVVVPIPKATSDFRKKQVTLASAAHNHTKQVIRVARRYGLDLGKKVDLTKDEAYNLEKDVQAITEKANSEADSLYATKKASIEGELK